MVGRHHQGGLVFGRWDAGGAPVGEVRRWADAGAVSETALAQGGQRWGVAWYVLEEGVYFRALEADGQPVSDAVKLDEAAASTNPSVSWDGQRWSVAWSALRGGRRELYLATLDGDGGSPSGPIQLTFSPAVPPRGRRMHSPLLR